MHHQQIVWWNADLQIHAPLIFTQEDIYEFITVLPNAQVLTIFEGAISLLLLH